MIEIILSLVGGFLATYIGIIAGSGGLISLATLLILNTPLDVAVATNRLAALGGSGMGLVEYQKAGKTDWKLGLLLSVPGVAGALIGSNLLVSLDTRTLELILAVVLIVMIPIMFINKRLGLDEHSTSSLQKATGFFLYFVFGILAGLFGTGIGTVLIIVTVGLFGKTFIRAAATNLVSWFLLSIAASAVFIANDIIDYRLLVPMAIGMIIGSWFGVRLAVKKGDGFVRIVLIVVQLAVVVKLLFF